MAGRQERGGWRECELGLVEWELVEVRGGGRVYWATKER